ncbi:MAG: Ig-like domain-containing protein [Thermomicrobiales bacterium]
MPAAARWKLAPSHSPSNRAIPSWRPAPARSIPPPGRPPPPLALTPWQNFPLGPYTIVATYGESDNINGSTGTATLTIVKANTRFATVTGETTYGTTTGTLRARLVRANGDERPGGGRTRRLPPQRHHRLRRTVATRLPAHRR